jgi:two-component sensor histidine kinase
VELPTNQPVWRIDQLRLAINAARVALWSWNVNTSMVAMDARAFEMWGLPWAPAVSFEELSLHIHPADRDRVGMAFVATRSVAGSYEIDFRILLGDEIRWISARGQGADADICDGVMFGIFLDVTGRKQAEEGNELLAGEMSHRVKNLLAIASSLTRITAKSASTVQDMTFQLTHRLAALGRAHDLLRPLPQKQGKAALLGDLLAVLLSPYDEDAAFSGRIRVAVPRMGIGENTANVLAMIIHELATNSIKYGALSVDEGSLDITGATDTDLLRIVWSETGGPAVMDAPALHGFGSKMLANSVSRHLRGSISYDWQATGLVVSLTAYLECLSE